jgi:hypothetical protein
MAGSAWMSRAVVVTCVVATHGCGGAPPADVVPAATSPCVIAEEPLAPDTLVFALTGTIDPVHAPVPTSDAERVVFRSLYETLIRVDCRGDVHPALAVSWRREDGGRRWVFELRPDAAFADGIPVTAASVAASWRLDEARRPRPWVDSVATSVAVRGERSLAVSIDRPHASVPRIFADPGLAVTRPAPDGAVWALGSGTFTVAEATRDRVLAIPVDETQRDRLPTLAYRTTGGDPRDLVDAGADLMLTHDPAVSAYATSVGGVRVMALPWDRVYALVVSAPSGDSARPEAAFPDDLTAAAAGADARTPVMPYWWQDADRCAALGSRARPAHEQPPVPRILYRRDDRTARGLAERVVALVTSGRLEGVLPAEGDPAQVAAAGLESPAYEVVLREGGVAGYVVAFARAVLDPCVAAGMLIEDVTWPAHIVPLVETRAHLLVRRLAGGIALDWDGVPYLMLPAQAP